MLTLQLKGVFEFRSRTRSWTGTRNLRTDHSSESVPNFVEAKGSSVVRSDAYVCYVAHHCMKRTEEATWNTIDSCRTMCTRLLQKVIEARLMSEWPWTRTGNDQNEKGNPNGVLTKSNTKNCVWQDVPVEWRHQWELKREFAQSCVRSSRNSRFFLHF